jgi:hypothetical protein
MKLNDNTFYLGIVGSEAAKFTTITERIARGIIRKEIIEHKALQPLWVVSGACHLGGIDIWAIQEAEELWCNYIEYPPAKLRWKGGYEDRNLKIARRSHRVICITVKSLPDSFKGPRYVYCYHCKTSTHIKSGGCWTVKKAKEMDKETAVYVVG